MVWESHCRLKDLLLWIIIIVSVSISHLFTKHFFDFSFFLIHYFFSAILVPLVWLSCHNHARFKVLGSDKNIMGLATIQNPNTMGLITISDSSELSLTKTPGPNVLGVETTPDPRYLDLATMPDPSNLGLATMIGCGMVATQARV